MTRIEASVRIGEGKAPIEDQHLVQERGPRAPMTKDEDGRLPDLRARNPAAVEQQLQPPPPGAQRSREEEHQQHGHPGQVHPEPIACQEPQQGDGAHAAPEPRDPELVLVSAKMLIAVLLGFRCHHPLPPCTAQQLAPADKITLRASRNIPRQGDTACAPPRLGPAAVPGHFRRRAGSGPWASAPRRVGPDCS